jgi:iron complex outermembrane receptor protein
MKQKIIRGVIASTALSAPLLVYAQVESPAATEPATTQEAAGDPTVKVMVSGIRRSLQSARNLKRDSPQIVDAIVADDIGKLPDRNVAESLARVSGVQVDRGIGEGSSIAVRGLRQNVTLFNGREIYDPAGRGGNGASGAYGSGSYGLMALVPSELISRLEVTKLPGADQIAGALGGVVDIRSRMPLDGPADLFAAKVGADYEQQAKKYGSELFGLVSHKFSDTFGMTASLSYNDRPVSQQSLDTFAGYKTFTDNTGKTLYGSQDVRAQDIQEKRKKLGFTAALQWKPMVGVEVSADTFYAKIDSDRDRIWLAFNPTDGLRNAVYSANNVLMSGQAVTTVTSNTEEADIKAEVLSSAVRAKFAINESLRGSAEASSGRSTSNYHQGYLRLQPLAGASSSVDFDFSSGAFGSYKFNGVNLLDPTTLRATILYDNGNHAKTGANALRADFTHSLEIPGVESVDFGARTNHLDSTMNTSRVDIRPAGGIPASQMAPYLQVYANPDFASGEFSGLPRSYLTGAHDAIRSCSSLSTLPAFSQNPQCLNPSATTLALGSTYEVKEAMNEAYIKFNYDTRIADKGVSGNLGIRVIDRKMDSIGNVIAPNGSATPTVFTRKDREWLPSAIMRVELADDTVVRLGAAKVVAFANTADLNNGLSLTNNAVFTSGTQTSLASGTAGSPNLNPFKANQVDLTIEKYFDKQSLVSLGLFNKSISSFIVQKQFAETYGGINYLINRQVNGEGATVRGAEVLLQMPFSFLPKPFNDFGMMATYSYIDSTTPIKDGAGTTLAFPGLSKNNVNLVAYYEAGPFSARLAYNWRDAYFVQLSAANVGTYNSAYTDLSATLRYDLSAHYSFNFEANNLRNSRQRTYDGWEEALRTNSVFGRIFKASVNVKF